MIQITVPVTKRPELNDAFYEYQVSADNYVATKVFAPLAVDAVRGEVEIVRLDNLIVDVPMARAANGTYNRIDQMLRVLDYVLIEKGAEHVVLLGEQNTIQYDKLVGASQLLKIKRWISREIDFRDVMFNAAVVPASARIGAVWTDPASVPLTDLIAARDNVANTCGTPPDTIVISRANLSRLLSNAQVRACFPGIPVLSMQSITDALPAICGYEKLHVSNAITAGGSIIPSDTVAVCSSVDAEAPAQVMASGRTFYWAEDANIDGVVEDYPSNEQRGIVVRIRDYQNPVLVNPLSAALITVE